MARSAETIVRDEVIYNVSNLVHILAEGCSAIVVGASSMREICDLAEQAQELAFPIEDWEEAAREAGWQQIGNIATRGAGDSYDLNAASWLDICQENDIEPYHREVFEHWIVSDWLADKLEAKGEKVDKDFAGMIVWARTTTGQAIAMDGVIQQIANELNNG